MMLKIIMCKKHMLIPLQVVKLRITKNVQQRRNVVVSVLSLTDLHCNMLQQQKTPFD